MSNPEIKKATVNIEDFAPRVLTAAFFNYVDRLPKGYRLQERYVYDYEFEFITFSNGSMIIDSKLYNIKKGDIIFRKPGQYTQGIMPYSCYLICVDLLNNTGKNPINYYIYNKQDFQNYCINPILEKIPTIFHPINMERSLRIFDSILKEFITPSPASDLFLRGSILNLIYYLYHDSIDPFINNSIPLSPHFSSLKSVIEYIENNLENRIMLNDLSKMANLSPNHFHRIFTSNVGITPNEFITKCKLDKAKKLLTQTSLSVAEISAKCGFENAPYFSYVFRKNTTLSPLEFRKRHSYI
jgi:AraC-like DNA-binding protein